MYTVFDLTNRRALATHPSYTALAALVYIQFANVDAVIVPHGQNKVYSQFDLEQLTSFYNQLPSRASLPGFAPPSYGDAIKTFRAALEADTILHLPFEAEMLEAQARAIDKDDSQPYAINPNGELPIKLRAWHCEPQVNRPRTASSYWVQFSSTNHGTASQGGELPSTPWTSTSRGGTVQTRNNPQHPTQEDPVMAKASKTPAKKAPAAKKTPATKAAPASKPEKAAKAPAEKKAPAAKAPRADRVEANGIVRPRAGGKCAAVWDIADKISAKKKSPATAAEVMEAGLAQELNESNIRAEYQRWRKFNGLTGRLPKAE